MCERVWTLPAIATILRHAEGTRHIKKADIAAVVAEIASLVELIKVSDFETQLKAYLLAELNELTFRLNQIELFGFDVAWEAMGRTMAAYARLASASQSEAARNPQGDSSALEVIQKKMNRTVAAAYKVLGEAGKIHGGLVALGIASSHIFPLIASAN